MNKTKTKKKKKTIKQSDVKYIKDWIKKKEHRNKVLLGVACYVIFILFVIAWIFIPIFTYIGVFGVEYQSLINSIYLYLGIAVYLIGGLIFIFFVGSWLNKKIW